MSKSALRLIARFKPDFTAPDLTAQGPRRIVVLGEQALVIVLAALFLWGGVLWGWRSVNTDFPNYYLVARLLREGVSTDRIYDWIWLQRVRDHLGITQRLVGFAGLTPFSALPIVPLALLSALAAKRVWIAINLALLAGTVGLLAAITGLSRRRVALLALLAILPLRASFLYGQMHVLVLALIVLGLYFYRRDKAIWSGTCLAVAAGLKIYPLLYGVYFVRKRQWRHLAALCVATVILYVLCYLCFGSSTMHTYLYQVLPRSVQGEILDPYSAHTASGSSFFHRMLLREPDLNPHPLLHSPFAYEVLYPLWQALLLVPVLALMRSSSDRSSADGGSRDTLEWGVFTALILVLSPVPAVYQFVVLIVGAVCIVAASLRMSRRLTAAVVVLYILVCNTNLALRDSGRAFSGLTLIAFSRLWFGMALWVLLLVVLWRHARAAAPKHLRLNSAWGWILLFAVIWTAGFISWRHHLTGLYADSARRLPQPSGSYLATDPHPSSKCLLSTAMLATGYRVVGEGCIGRPARVPPSEDELSAAIDAGSTMLWIERATAGGSRLEQFLNEPAAGDNSSSAMTVAMTIPDGESPVLSRDGHWLAFLRETQGRGSLWIVDLSQAGDQSGELTPKMLLPDVFDVRGGAFMPSGDIVLVARRTGKNHLYRLKPGDIPVAYTGETNDVLSPSISTDGTKWVVAELIHDRWQLVRIAPANGERRQLTFGDCNAYAPAWRDEHTVVYATDCGRGMGLTALACVPVD